METSKNRIGWPIAGSNGRDEWTDIRPGSENLMRCRSKIRPTSHNAAFTLIELLVVIGIIVVLVGLLLPVARKVRISGQTVATQSTMNRIAQGCEAYYQEFHAYPGPFADGQLVNSESVSSLTLDGTITGVPLQYLTDATADTAVTFDHSPTSSENLFLGLCGGLRLKTNKGVIEFQYDPELARKGSGPIGLNVDAAKKSQGFIDITDADISADSGRNPLNDASVQSSLWWPNATTGSMAATSTFKGDSKIFEFVDRFASPKPILYLRARRGTARTGSFSATNKSGFIYDTKNAANTNPYQFDPSQIENAYANISAYRDGSGGPNVTWSPDVIDYPDFNDPNNAGTVVAGKGNERYFVNAALTTGNPTDGYTLVPQGKDKYLLISAGPDGIYGTADDIRQ